MKTKTKLILSIILILSVFITQGLFFINAEDIGEEMSMLSSFPDVKEHWAQQSIEKFLKKGWIKGYEDGLFRPDKLISRAEFTAIVVNALNGMDSSSESSFIDVNPDQWFYKAVSYAVEKGYIEGYPDNTFKPYGEMTRQEVAVFSQKLLKVPMFEGNEEAKFEDEEEFADWAKESIKILASHEIIKGYPDNTFRPGRYITRAEAVRMLDIVLKEIIEPETTLPGYIPTPEITPEITPEPTPESTPTPTPVKTSGSKRTPSKPKSTPTPSPKDIDLLISSFKTKDVFVDSDSLERSGQVVIEISNNGKDDTDIKYDLLLFEDVNLDKKFDLKVDNVISTLENLTGPKSGETMTYTIEVGGKALFKDNLIFAFVDYKNAVKETDEENNITFNKANCKLEPVVGEFNPVLEWEWTGSNVSPSSNQVMCAPVVANLNDDNEDGEIDMYDIPDIVFNTFVGSQYTYGGTLRAISGDGKKELFSVTDYYTVPGSTPAIGDIDGDGIPEILVLEEFIEMNRKVRVLAFNNNGELKWASPVLTHESIDGIASIAIGDIDADGEPDIVLGNNVLDNKGEVKWQGLGGYGKMNSIIADIDLDGFPEVVAGNTAYRSNGEILWQNTAVGDGFTAVGNFDDDEFAEIVVVTQGYVYLLEHTGEKIFGPVDIPPAGTDRDHGGPPTVADFDNDGMAEIGVAGGYNYVVFETDGTVKWTSRIRDYSSNVTGSSVFDFEGDGIVEVVYCDEEYLRIYRGTDGQVLFSTYIGSGTLLEMPVVVDVDNDNNAEIVVASNSYAFGGKTGIQVFGDLNDTWVNTRKIWNQHSYHITNVNDDGTIPRKEENNWQIHNNYRCNKSVDELSCVDLTASYMRLNEDNGRFEIIVRIGNSGALHVREGVKIAFFDGDPSDEGVLLGTLETTKMLVPGEYEDVSFMLEGEFSGVHTIYAAVDNDGFGHGIHRETSENNNITSSEFDFGIVYD